MTYLPELDGPVENPPFFSVCIPAFNRCRYLEKTLEDLSQQTFKNFEVIVIDDGSTDETPHTIPQVLSHLFPRNRFASNKVNLGFDATIRKLFSLASGRYLVCLGSDEIFSDQSILNEAAELLKSAEVKEQTIDVVVGNYREASSDDVQRIISASNYLGAGPSLVANHFRKFSFFSGLIFSRERILPHLMETRYDGTGHLQVFYACSILGHGGTLFGWNKLMVIKDIPINGQRSEVTTCLPIQNSDHLAFRSFNFIGLAVAGLPLQWREKNLKSSQRKMFWNILTRSYPYGIYHVKKIYGARDFPKYLNSLMPIFMPAFHLPLVYRMVARMAGVFYGIFVFLIPLNFIEMLLRTELVKRYRK